MAWIESHQALRDHPKTKRAARLLGISVPAVLGHLHLLWWWALDYAPTGDLSRFEDADLAEAMLWDGPPDQLIDVLQAVDFLDCDGDGSLSLHDWNDYAGRLIDRRDRNAERMRAARAAEPPSSNEARAQHVRRTLRARVQLPTNLPTGPTIPTEPTEPTGPTVPTDREQARAAAPPPADPEPAAPPPMVNSVSREVPRARGVNLQPLVDAFRARGLKMPVITKRSAPQAGELLKHYAPEQIARCWQDVLTLDWGDDWLLKNLSFESLNSHNRLGNWVRDRDTPQPEPEELTPVAPRPLLQPKPDIPPEERQRVSSWKLALERIQSETRDQDFRSWFKGTQLVEAGPGGCVIACDEHQWPWLDKNRAKIARALGIDQELVEFRARPVPVGASP